MGPRGRGGPPGGGGNPRQHRGGTKRPENRTAPGGGDARHQHQRKRLHKFDRRGEKGGDHNSPLHRGVPPAKNKARSGATKAIPRRSHHEGRVFWWSWNHFLLIDGVLSALKWLDIVAPFGSRLGRAQRSTCVLRLRAAYVILGLHGHIPLVSAVRKYRRGGARKSVSMTSHVASYRLPSPPAERRDPPRRPFCGRSRSPELGGAREIWYDRGGARQR